MEMKYCEHCQRNVDPEKAFSWLAFILWCSLLGIGGLVYLLYHRFIVAPDAAWPLFVIPGVLAGIGSAVYLVYFWFIKTPQCPMCGNISLLPARPSGDESRAQEG